MQFSVQNAAATTIDSDLAVVWVSSEDISGAVEAWSSTTDLAIEQLMGDEHFKAKPAETFVLRGVAGSSKRIVFVGIGDASDIRNGSVRKAAVAASRIATDVRAETIVASDLAGSEQEVVEGLVLGGYKFRDYLTEEEDAFGGVQNVVLAFAEHAAKDHAFRGEVIASAVNHARDLVNQPPNDLYPETLAQAGAEIAKYGNLECTIFDEKELEEKGMNLILAVGKGSVNPPRLVHMIYKPEGDTQHVIAFVGKGVTFDTGGYNLKPGGSMLNMHCDMGGAAAVLGAAKAIAELRPPNVEVHFVVPTAENTIANNSFKPQDIFRGYGGKTVEIHNTDAEGRLILADALAYIQEQGVDKIIDLATLTGACVVALGEYTSGMFTNDDEMANAIIAASNKSGEDFWRLPLTEKLEKLIDTPMADMKNVGSRWGGAITAALFLKRWVNIDNWCHLDIAGPAWADSEEDLSPKGGTGFAVSTLVNYALAHSE